MIAGIEKAVQVAANLEKTFWSNWKEYTKHFPDIEDSDSIKQVALQVSLISLMGSYLLGYQSEARSIYLEEFIKSLRLLETELRDIE